MILQPMIITFIIMLIVIFLLLQSKYRPDLIVIGALLFLSVLGILTPEEALSGFSNSTVIMMAGLFIVGAGVVDTGIVMKMGDSLLKWGGKNEKKMLMLIILMISMFIGILNIYGMIVLLIPVMMSIAFKLKLNPSFFLLPLVFAGSIGGLLTLIGSPSNLIVSDYLVRAGYSKLGFFQITGIGIVVLVATLLFFLTIGKRLMPVHTQSTSQMVKRISAGELAGLYKVYDRLHFIIVPDSSDIVGERLSKLRLPSQYEITVIDIEREIKEEHLSLLKKSIIARANEVIFPNDLLFVFGESENVNRFVKDYELVPSPFDAGNVQSHFLSKTYGVTEILIAPHSSMENLTISDMHFREKYSCNVLAINRKGEYLQSDLANERLKSGDALLVHGKWEDIEIVGAEKQDFVVLGSNTEEDSNQYSKGKTPIALGILLVMLLCMIFDILPNVVSVTLAAFLMIVTGCIRSIEEAYKRIGWEVILLLACSIPIAKAIEKTGVTQFLTNGMIDLFGSYHPYVMLIAFYVITSFFSQFIHNLVSVVIIAPIAIATAIAMGLSPYPFVIGVAIAATLSFAVTATASPTNALVMTAGGYKLSDFVKIAIPIQLFAGILALLTIPVFFPF